jgi:hypothetical protein
VINERAADVSQISQSPGAPSQFRLAQAELALEGQQDIAPARVKDQFAISLRFTPACCATCLNTTSAY